MISGILCGDITSLLEKGLDLASLRHWAISNNIANVNTPGYKRRDVDFQAEMRKAMEDRQSPGEPGADGPGTVFVDQSTSLRNDGNNVDVDFEMTCLAENSILYSALARQLSSRFQLMRTVITEGRR